MHASVKIALGAAAAYLWLAGGLTSHAQTAPQGSSTMQQPSGGQTQTPRSHRRSQKQNGQSGKTAPQTDGQK